MNVYKEDLSKIGHTFYGKDGFLAVLCSLDTAGIESILLREILALDDYLITETNDFEWTVEGGGNTGTDIEFVTSYLWADYKESRSNDTQE